MTNPDLKCSSFIPKSSVHFNTSDKVSSSYKSQSYIRTTYDLAKSRNLLSFLRKTPLTNLFLDHFSFMVRGSFWGISSTIAFCTLFIIIFLFLLYSIISNLKTFL